MSTSELPPGNLSMKNKTRKQWTVSGAMSLMEICLSKELTLNTFHPYFPVRGNLLTTKWFVTIFNLYCKYPHH